MRDKVKIINLMGMETGLYGLDVGSNYAKMLKAILDLDQSYQVHIAQFNPEGINKFGDELLPLFQNKRVTDIQLPIQSTSTRLLKMMNRKNHSDVLGPFLKQVRAVNTRAVLRTDLIIGWPSEIAEERHASLTFAGEHFDEIALYTIELSPDLPAWKYQNQAFTNEQLEQIRVESRAYLLERFDVVVHSGQQDDSSMKSAEELRKKLRARKLQQSA